MQTNRLLLTPKMRLLIAAALALLTITLFMSFNVKASWEFTLMFRGKKLLTFLIVAFCISTATLLFQSMSNNRIITPAIMGFDALYMLIQTSLVFTLGAIQYAALNNYFKWAIEISILVVASSFLFQWLFIKKQFNLYLLILIGVVFGVLFRSFSSLMMRMIDPTEFGVLQDSLFASFNAADSYLLTISGVVVCLISGFIFRYHHQFDVMALGKPIATNLGINHADLTRASIVIITVLIGLSTSLVGPVTFFGLLVVNVAYIVCGTHLHRYLIPMSILTAIICLVGSDVLLQHVLHYNTKLSIIIEFIGGVFFLGLILRKKI
ncbi:MAG: iron chelate uptake ABC transporter family permease subunit [Oceanospirillaceae bacterium]|nr:iron chelate uptake ABC transporter family permease subunit [Oceanospirillaceae bacterium]